MKIDQAYDKSMVSVVVDGAVKAAFSVDRCFVLNAEDGFVLEVSRRRIDKKAWTRFRETVNKYYKLSIDPNSFDTSFLET